jgi:ketosteroid isomerase-like protein
MATKPETEKSNKQVVQAGFDAWREGTGGVFDLLVPDAEWTIVGNSPVSRTYTSRQEFLDVVINPFNARLSGRLVPAVRALYADGDTVIALFDAEGTARDGKPYKNTYTWYMQMRDGRIVNVIAFFDTIEFTDFWTRITPEQVVHRTTS